MRFKMSELVKRSGVSKSTILYYIKEGLLPSPYKPKQNVHLYDEKTLKILNFIKYFQHNLGYSISHIKEILTDNKIDFQSDTDIVLGYLKAMQNKENETQAQRILLLAKEAEVDDKLFKAYEKCAKELAVLEYEMGAKLLTSKEDNQNNKLQKLIFDILLTLKPYIFNQATLKEHKKRVAKNLKKDRK